MNAVIGLLRAVNLAGRNRIKMDALRELCTSLKLRNPQTYVQSGNVVFSTNEDDLTRLATRIAKAIERSFGFPTEVILRTAAEMRNVVARNPFAKRRGIEPSRLLVVFLADKPDQEAEEKLRAIKVNREELRMLGRELFVYFPDGFGRSKVSMAAIERAVKTPGTGRNWNSVNKLLAMAEKLESS